MIAREKLTPVSVVAAPEGFGKSQRVREMLDGIDKPIVHFYPAADQTSLYDLLHGLVLSAAVTVRGLASSFASAVEYARTAPEPEAELAPWVLRHLEGVEAVFVLHDVDRITDRRFLDLLRRVIEGAESTVSWIFIGRRLPQLPWDDWKAFGLAGAAVTEDDLRLTEDAALENARAWGVTSMQAREIFEATGGWPLAYKLALATGAAPGTPVEELAAREVGELDEDIRETLVRASVLEEFDQAFADAAGFSDEWLRITELANEGIVLVHLPSGVVKFRDVFRAEFHAILQQRGDEAVREARIAAARAFENSGRLLTALRLYSSWGLSGDVLRLSSAHGFDLIELGHVGVLHAALTAIEHEVLQENAVALTIMAMEEARAGRQDIAEAWFLHAIARARNVCERAAVTYRYVLERVRSGRVEGIELLESLLQEPELTADLRATVSSTVATAYVLAERFTEARQAIDAALSDAERYGDAAVLAKTLHHAAWVALFSGDIEGARNLGYRAVTTACACEMYDCAARASTVLYNIAYDIEDDPAQSSALLDQILDFGMQAGSAPMRLFALLGKFDIATERGDAQSLQWIERSLSSYELHFSDAMTSAALVSGQALFLAGRGRYAEAYELRAPTAERQITKDRRALRLAEMALYGAAAGHRDAAARAAEEAQEIMAELPTDRRRVRVQGNLVLAYRLLEDGTKSKALLDDLQSWRDAVGARSRAFIDALGAVLTRWDGVANRSVLSNRLETMELRDLGGFAALLTSLPLHPRVPPRAIRSTDALPRQVDCLTEHREEVVASALETCTPALRQTLLSDLVASATIDRIVTWLKQRSDSTIIEWAQHELERWHNMAAAAHLFGDTISACASLLQRERLLDVETENALSALRQTLDAHVTATQVRLATELIDPVDPVDAKIDDLLQRLFLRDEITFEHSRCVGAWCARLAKRMHLTRDDAQLVMRSGIVHDIGKVLTPPEILKAPRGLTSSEWAIMRRHTLDGVRILEPIKELHPLIPAVRWHHERYDGKGYPDAMQFQDIPFAARIVAVADAFNAMIARRPYREPMSPPAAIEQLKSASGTHFDPAVVSNMIDVVLRPDR